MVFSMHSACNKHSMAHHFVCNCEHALCFDFLSFSLRHFCDCIGIVFLPSLLWLLNPNVNPNVPLSYLLLLYSSVSMIKIYKTIPKYLMSVAKRCIHVLFECNCQPNETHIELKMHWIFDCCFVMMVCVCVFVVAFDIL